MSAPERVTVKVDDRSVEVDKGLGLVETAAAAGIEIPVFCYEPRLGPPVGACRMCLVEVEGIPKPSPAVLTWSHRLLGAAGIPLWIAAWRNHVPHIPAGILMPVGVGIAVAVAAELLSDRRQSRRL